ncbi:MAG: hypothetical protein KC431_29565, partial [Myxococcales bacterium]|nr:hypothetical protein [Myxococcales bacterium]
MGLSVILLAACAEPEEVSLIAIEGCGLDQEFSGLRIRVLGDFAPGVGQELVLAPGESGSLTELRADAVGVAAEGLFGTTVTAVGRSYGVDASLAGGRLGSTPALAVYFAAPDRACAVAGGPAGRSALAGAESPRGEVLLVGGRDPSGAALDELVHVDLLTGEARALETRLEQSLVGASVVAIGPRRFALIGGARAGAVFSTWIPVTLTGAGDGLDAIVEEPQPLVAMGVPVATHDHAFARSPVDGAVLLAGGCTTVTADDRCVVGSAESQVHWLRSSTEEPGFELEQAPGLARRRFAAAAVIDGSGVAYVAGGIDESGATVAEVERLLPGKSWEVVHTLAGGERVSGAAVLDGELLVLATIEGTVHWWSPVGAGILEAGSRAPTLDVAPEGRALAMLSGERVLADGWIFAPGSAAVDPAGELRALDTGDRSGALLLPVADGTVVIAGGVDAASLPVEPTLLRLRPALDGPDEWIPDLTGPDTDAFVGNAPGRATVVVGGLHLDGID